MLDAFVKTYTDRRYRFPAMVRHAGVVLAFAMDQDRRIVYTVLDLADATSPLDVAAWLTNPRQVSFATELASVGFAAADPAVLPQVKLGTTAAAPSSTQLAAADVDPFLSSTARLSAAVPFQVLSDGQYVYLLRQAISDPDPATLEAAQRTLADPQAEPQALAAAQEVVTDHQNMVYAVDAAGAPVTDADGRLVPLVAGTLLVDRFVLVGTDLQPKLEVRYQRSRSKNTPASRTDSLGPADLDHRPFVEPTQELRFLPGLGSGWFSAVLVPTSVADTYRWQIFTADAASGVWWSYTVARSADGLFDTAPGAALQPAGAAGSALSLGTDGDRVELTGCPPLGGHFTIEAWVQPTTASGEHLLVGGGADDAHSSPTVRVVDGTKLRVGFGDGTALQSVTTAAVLRPEVWQHLAATFDGTALTILVDGVPVHTGTELSAKVPAATAVDLVGAASGGYLGAVDEVRMWQLARQLSDVRDAMHVRLSGLEPGLVSYWRFDEGTGTRVWDQAGTATGELHGAGWITSGASIGPSAGLGRTALRLSGHTPAGGLSSTLYYLQEDAPSGYDGISKPQKTSARVMLAAVGAPPSEGTSDGAAPVAAALDFGVGLDGRLADLPTEMTLSDLAGATTGGQPTNVVLDQLAAQEERVAGLDEDVAAAQQAVAVHSAQLTAALQALTLGGFPATSTLLPGYVMDITVMTQAVLGWFSSYQYYVQQGNLASQAMAEQQTQERQAVLRQVLIPAQETLVNTDNATLASLRQQQAQARADLAATRQQVNGDVAAPMPLLHLDGNGLSVSGAVLDFAATDSLPVLFDSALGRLGLYFRGAADQLSVAYYDTFTGRARYTVAAGPGGVVSFRPRTVEAELDGLTISVAAGSTGGTHTVTVTLPLAAGAVTETWKDLPADPEQLAAVLNGTTASPTPIGAATAASGSVSAVTLTAPLDRSLPAGTLLAVGGEVLTVSAATVPGASSIPIQRQQLSTAAGATVSVVTYDYARSASTTLVGASLQAGSRLVVVDARAAAGPLAGGDATLTGPTPSAQWFGAPPGTTLDYDGTSTLALVLSQTALAFDGKTSSVSLGNPAALDLTGPITLEAWVRPAATDGLRDVVARGYSLNPAGEVFLRVNGGSYQAGSWDGNDHVASAVMPAGDVGTWVHLAGVHDGSAWRLYRNGVLLASQADPVGAVPVAAGWAVASSAGGDRFFDGDIDEVRLWSRPRGALEIAGSMATRLSGTEAGLVGYWYATEGKLLDHSPSHADGTLRGTPQPAASPPELVSVGGFDAPDDLSIEGWVNPIAGGSLARLVEHRSDASEYLLALRKVPSALTLDGTSQFATTPEHSPGAPPDPLFTLTGPITLEAWIRPEKTDGERYIAAHGLDADLHEVALRINNNAYQVGSYDGTDHYAVAAIPAEDVGHWVHLAGVYDGTSWTLYRNGTQMATLQDPVGAIPVSAGWAIGASADRQRFFAGSIAEVRVWNRPRTLAEITATMRRWLAGSEDALVACWRYDGTALVDITPSHRAVEFTGTPVDGPVPGFTAVAGVGTQYAETAAAFAGGYWRHLALAFSQRHGLAFAGTGAYLDAGTGNSLDLTGDLTLEVAGTLDDLATPQGLLARGRLADGSDQRVPYALVVRSDGSILLEFEDTEGNVVSQASSANVVTAGGFHRIAVTRKRYTSVSTSDELAVVDRYDDIEFVVDGKAAGSATYRGKDPGSSDQPLTIGSATGTDGTPYSLRGTLAEVQLWNTARKAEDLGAPITGTEVGLVAWWQLAEGSGNVAGDTKGGNAATLHGAVSWVKTPDPGASALSIHLDGVPVATQPAAQATYRPATTGFALGGSSGAAALDLLTGQLEEVRVWHVTRTTEQIQDNLFRRLTGDLQDLIAYYTFAAEPVGRLSDDGPRGNDLAVLNGSYLLSTAPIGEDAPQVRNAVAGAPTDYTATVAGQPAVAEYADLQAVPGGASTGVFKRCYASVDDDGDWSLITGFKVGDMSVEWVGQAQFNPQLVGYIEGAPPVPSENLTADPGSYQDAGTVSLTEADNTTYTYASSNTAGVDAGLELSASFGDKTQSYAGLMEIEAPLGIGVGEVELTSVESTDVSGGVSVSLETSTSWLQGAQTGTGSTLTQVSSLDLTGHTEPATAIAYPFLGARYLPDNTGMALVQSQTADVYALRLQHTGALIAYQMRANPDIPKDWNILTFPIDPHYTKQGTLDGKVGDKPDPDYPNALTYSPDISYFKPIEAYQLKEQISREQQELATFYAQFNAGPGGLGTDAGSVVPQPTARNLVNEYVWTAAGGQFALTQQTLDTRSETTGGSFSLTASLSASLDVSFTVFSVGADIGLTATVGGHLDLEVSKTKETDTSFEVDVSVSPDRDISAVAADGTATKQPGKVDAYRFMTFYLAPSSDHYDAFFDQVVDPVWLAQSNDPAAAALRQVQQPAKRPACWRLLHRVTYVSRVLAAPSQGGDPFDEALLQLDIDSNYQLIKALEPYVASKTARYADFRAAVAGAVATRLPDLLPHLEEIVTFLALYYGVTDAPGVAGGGVGAALAAVGA